MSLRNEAYNSIKKKMRRLSVMDKISIIIPCFNEEDALPIYYDEMKKVMDIMKKQSDFELIFVDDGSSDRTYEIMKELHRKDGRCQYLSFSRNFGKAVIFTHFQYRIYHLTIHKAVIPGAAYNLCPGNLIDHVVKLFR